MGGHTRTQKLHEANKTLGTGPEGGECVGSVTTLLLAETKESERMDTSSKQQRTYEESKRESGKRNGKSKELETETGNWKSLNWESLKLETGK
jgi:hypothetical protein